MSTHISTDGYRACIDGNYIKLISPGEDIHSAGVKTLSGHGGHVWSVCFSRDGTLLASGSGDGEVKVLKVGSGECVKTLTPTCGGGWVKIVCFYPDGSSISSTARSEAVDEVPWWNMWEVEQKTGD
jgi:WD40 repeat protein